MSTFVAKGSSYEATDNSHDDLMMNLVLFGWYSTTQMFLDETDINVRQMLFAEKMLSIENDVLPFGIIDDGRTETVEEVSEVVGGDRWFSVNRDNIL